MCVIPPSLLGFCFFLLFVFIIFRTVPQSQHLGERLDVPNPDFCCFWFTGSSKGFIDFLPHLMAASSALLNFFFFFTLIPQLTKRKHLILIWICWNNYVLCLSVCGLSFDYNNTGFSMGLKWFSDGEPFWIVSDLNKRDFCSASLAFSPSLL